MVGQSAGRTVARGDASSAAVWWMSWHRRLRWISFDAYRPLIRKVVNQIIEFPAPDERRPA